MKIIQEVEIRFQVEKTNGTIDKRKAIIELPQEIVLKLGDPQKGLATIRPYLQFEIKPSEEIKSFKYHVLVSDVNKGKEHTESKKDADKEMATEDKNNLINEVQLKNKAQKEQFQSDTDNKSTDDSKNTLMNKPWKKVVFFSTLIALLILGYYFLTKG